MKRPDRPKASCLKELRGSEQGRHVHYSRTAKGYFVGFCINTLLNFTQALLSRKEVCHRHLVLIQHIENLTSTDSQHQEYFGKHCAVDL